MANNNINDWEEVAVDDWQDVTDEPRQPQSEEAPLSNIDIAGLAALDALSFGSAPKIKGALEAPFSDKTYEQIVNEDRALFKRAEEQNPALFTGAGFASNFLPGSLAIGTAKAGITALKQAPTLIKGVKAVLPGLAKMAGVGAGYGALEGAGRSDADNVKEFTEDVLDTAETGALVGGSLGIAIPGVMKAGQKIGQGIKAVTDYIPTGKLFKRARELTLGGKKFTGDDARRKILNESKVLAKNIQESIEGAKETSSKGIGKILKRSDDKVDMANEIGRIQKAVENTDPSTSEGKNALKELENIVNNFKQIKTTLVKPQTLVKTGEEKALEKLTKKQAKLAEEAKLKGESLEFTQPEVTDEFVTSSQIAPGKAMVEPIPTGEFNPVKFVETPEITTKVLRPQVLAKTGEEKALNKLLQKQAKMTEEARIVNETIENRATTDLTDDAVVGVDPYNFTNPEVSDEFISSAAFNEDKIKPMVEPISTGEFNPVKFLQEKIAKYEVQKPASLVKTGEETALEKMLQTQAKLKEQMALQGKKIDFTKPTIGDEFVTSSQVSPGKPMVEPITSGEFNPIQIIQQPEIVANLNAQELQTLKKQIGDIQSKQDIGDIASKRVAQAKSVVDEALTKKAIAPELSPKFQELNKRFGAAQDSAKIVDKDLVSYLNPTEEQTALNKLSSFLRKPMSGRSGDDLRAKKDLFFSTLQKANPNQDTNALRAKADELAELYDMNIMGESIFGGVSTKDMGSLLGTGRAVSMRAGQAAGVIEKGLGNVSEAVQLDRRLAKGLSNRSPELLKKVLTDYNENRLKAMTLGTALRKPSENKVESRNDSRQEFMTQGIDSLNKSSTTDLQAFSESLISTGKPGAQKYADTLAKLANTETKNRSALTFGLMSDPNFRQLYREQMNPVGVEENEE